MLVDMDWINDIFFSVIIIIDRLGKEFLCKLIYRIGCLFVCIVNLYLLILDLYVYVLVF